MKHGEQLFSDSGDNAKQSRRAKIGVPTPRDNSFESLKRIISSEEWREFCLRDREGFSANSTYLAQMMAHDITRSSNMDTRFRAERTDTEDWPPNRPVNLRDVPLLLHTLYGEGIDLDPQLFKEKTGREQTARFAVTQIKTTESKPDRIGPAFYVLPEHAGRRSFELKPRLGDSRNADQPILLSIVTAFMRLHNYYENHIPGKVTRKYIEARVKTTLAWHQIIKSEIIDKMLAERSAALPKGMSVKSRDVDAIQGLFRAFHCLPLPKYKINSEPSRPLLSFLANSSTRPLFQTNSNGMEVALSTWARDWLVDFDVFLNSHENRTAFSPVLASDFASENIFDRDRDKLTDFGVSSTEKYKSLADPTQKMLEKMSEFLKPGENLPSAKDVPLSLAFLAEALDTPGIGSLGPVASALARKLILPQIDRAEKALENLTKGFEATAEVSNIKAWKKQAPKNFKELLDLISSNSNQSTVEMA